MSLFTEVVNHEPQVGKYLLSSCRPRNDAVDVSQSHGECEPISLSKKHSGASAHSSDTTRYVA